MEISDTGEGVGWARTSICRTLSVGHLLTHPPLSLTHPHTSPLPPPDKHRGVSRFVKVEGEGGREREGRSRQRDRRTDRWGLRQTGRQGQREGRGQTGIQIICRKQRKR